jgi:O-antigen/teichoic acid export membrane protein
VLVSTVVVQILQVPLIVGVLGPAQFATFVIGSAYAAIVATGDFGTFGTSSTRLINLIEEKRKPEAARLASSMFSVYFLLISIGLVGAATIVTLTEDILVKGQFRLSELTELILLTSAHACLLLFSTLWEAYNRGLGNHVRAWQLISLLRVMDFSAFGIFIWLGRDLPFAILMMLIVRILFTGLLIFEMRRLPDRLPIRISWAGIAYLRQNMLTSSAASAQVLGTWLSNQGLVLALSSYLGQGTGALYSALRTFLGGIKQLSQALINSEMPAITRGHITTTDLQNYLTFRRVQKQVISIAILIAIPMALGGHYIFDFWSRGQLELANEVLGIFVVVTVLEIFILTSSVWAVTQNKHFQITAAFAIALVLVCVNSLIFQPNLLFVGVSLALVLITVEIFIEFRIKKMISRKQEW